MRLQGGIIKYRAAQLGAQAGRQDAGQGGQDARAPPERNSANLAVIFETDFFADFMVLYSEVSGNIRANLCESALHDSGPEAEICIQIMCAMPLIRWPAKIVGQRQREALIRGCLTQL